MKIEPIINQLENQLNELEKEELSFDDSLKVYKAALSTAQKLSTSFGKIESELDVLDEELTTITLSLNEQGKSE